MSDILYDTSRLMHGQLLKFSKAKGFNSLSWNEEQQKESSRDVWRTLVVAYTEAPSDSTADGKKHIFLLKRYEFARKRNKTNFVVVNNVYLHKINE